MARMVRNAGLPALLFCFTLAVAPSQTIPSIPGLPGTLLWQNTPRSWHMDKANVVTISAEAKTDWFVDPFDGTVAKNAPILLFAPDSDYVLGARVTLEFVTKWDAGIPEDQALAFLTQLDRLSDRENFIPNVGPGMMHESDDPATMLLLERALSTLPNIEASTIIADDAGIHWKTIRRTAELVKYVSEHSPHSQGTFNFTATAMLKPLSPFFPGSYHTGSGRQFAIGFEGANIVRDVFIRDKENADAAVADLTAALTKHASVADTVGNKVAAETGWAYAGVDPTPAPLGDVSIGTAIEAFTGAKFGSSGTLTAARIITTAVKAVPLKQVGYSGLMVPVMEDKLLAQRWAESTYNIDSLLAYSAVCGTGLDTIPLPGEISLDQMERIYADVASLATKWNKPLSARLQPVPNKKPGDQTDFQDPYLFNTTVHSLP